MYQLKGMGIKNALRNQILVNILCIFKVIFSVTTVNLHKPVCCICKIIPILNKFTKRIGSAIVV